jgi:hypothetical protein
MFASMFGLRLSPVVPIVALLTTTLALTAVGCRGGCARRAADGSPPGVLAMFPPETRMVLAIDFRKVRDSGLWRELFSLAGQDPEDRRLIETFTKRTGLDPFQQIHRVYAAFPEEARRDGAFALYFEGQGFDEQRLLAYAREEARTRGHTIVSRLHAGRTLWVAPRAAAAPGQPPASASEVGGFFLDDSRFVLAGGGWAQRMLDLGRSSGAPAASAAGNTSLLHLAERIGPGRAFWLAAIVPEGTRQRLIADARFGVQASVMRFAMGADLSPGIAGELHAELSNADDARVMAGRVTSFVREAKKSPQALLLGAGPYLDAVRADASGSTATVKIHLDEPLTRELVTRLGGFLRSRR